MHKNVESNWDQADCENLKYFITVRHPIVKADTLYKYDTLRFEITGKDYVRIGAKKRVVYSVHSGKLTGIIHDVNISKVTFIK